MQEPSPFALSDEPESTLRRRPHRRWCQSRTLVTAISCSSLVQTISGDNSGCHRQESHLMPCVGDAPGDPLARSRNVLEGLEVAGFSCLATPGHTWLDVAHTLRDLPAELGRQRQRLRYLRGLSAAENAAWSAVDGSIVSMSSSMRTSAAGNCSMTRAGRSMTKSMPPSRRLRRLPSVTCLRMRPQPTRSKTNERGRFEEATGFEAARAIGPLQGGMAAPLWLGGYCSAVTFPADGTLRRRAIAFYRDGWSRLCDPTDRNAASTRRNN